MITITTDANGAYIDLSALYAMNPTIGTIEAYIPKHQILRVYRDNLQIDGFAGDNHQIRIITPDNPIGFNICALAEYATQHPERVAGNVVYPISEFNSVATTTTEQLFSDIVDWLKT